MKDPEAVEAVVVAGGNVEVILEEDEGEGVAKWKILENLEANTLPTNDFKKNLDLLKMCSLFVKNVNISLKMRG